MFRHILIAALLVLLTGCASSFKPSDKMMQYKQGMDKQAAAAVFAKYARPSPGSSGYCGGNKFMVDPGTPINVTSEGYTMRAFKRGDLISKEQIGTTTKYTYKKVYYEDGRKFGDITKIRISQGGPLYGNCTAASKTGYALSLHFSTIDLDGIGIANTALDEMMAALTTLAPQAKLIQGVGF
jgi:hypothetical protein